jgi:hypothetical protein
MATNSAFQLEASTTELRTELATERLLVAELTHTLKDLERTHTHQTNELTNLLAAEQQKTQKLMSMTVGRSSANLTDLEQQLAEAIAREQQLLSECESLRKLYDKEVVDLRHRELATQNFAFKQKIKSLEREKQSTRDDAVTLN